MTPVPASTGTRCATNQTSPPTPSTDPSDCSAPPASQAMTTGRVSRAKPATRAHSAANTAASQGARGRAASRRNKGVVSRSDIRPIVATVHHGTRQTRRAGGVVGLSREDDCNRSSRSRVATVTGLWEVRVTPDEFDAFYEGSARRLIGQVYAMTGDLAEAQDLVQEAFVRAWDKGRRLDSVDNPEAWVRTVAVRLATSRWRRTRTAVKANRKHGPPPDTPAHAPDHVALVAALEADSRGPAHRRRPAPPLRPVCRAGRRRDWRPCRHRQGPAVPRPSRSRHASCRVRGGGTCLSWTCTGHCPRSPTPPASRRIRNESPNSVALPAAAVVGVRRWSPPAALSIVAATAVGAFALSPLGDDSTQPVTPPSTDNPTVTTPSETPTPTETPSPQVTGLATDPFLPDSEVHP